MAAEDWYDPCEVDDNPAMNGLRLGSYLDRLVGRVVNVKVKRKPKQEAKPVGEEADWEIERMIFGPMDRTKRTVTSRGRSFQSGAGNFKWRRADGQIIDMHDMDDEYIANCIAICKKSGNNGKEEQLQAILNTRQKLYLDNARTAASVVTLEDPDAIDKLRVGASNSVPILPEFR